MHQIHVIHLPIVSFTITEYVNYMQAKPRIISFKYMTHAPAMPLRKVKISKGRNYRREAHRRGSGVGVTSFGANDQQWESGSFLDARKKSGLIYCYYKLEELSSY